MTFLWDIKIIYQNVSVYKYHLKRKTTHKTYLNVDYFMSEDSNYSFNYFSAVKHD